MKYFIILYFQVPDDVGEAVSAAMNVFFEAEL